ncbi:prenyltransferase/squalene oxidase repeat-containing protein [Aggregatilinea lenta]|uniref:prenyltransferase/squalene oxidase repeat-containing protein n=1 Tax=Aggregatilinea lenta TaxID=913108 RepID=UPI000E5C112E|nr:prenyltransferase/squalene oxidase repeat-containing protein [Aggregatilinea lenta]
MTREWNTLKRRNPPVGTQLSAPNPEVINHEIDCLLAELAEGRVEGVAYDTAWIARLGLRYPGNGFESALEWLRRNQYEDGSWGGPLVQYHDRFISTLAAIVALREAGADPRDERRVRRGESILWKIMGRLGRDDSDTIGFPILSASLATEATALGLDVPMPPMRFASAYRKKVQALLDNPNRNWRATTVAFSLEALRNSIRDSDQVLEANGSVASSPSATAAFLLSVNSPNEQAALDYLQRSQQEDGSVPAVAPIDLFSIAWSLTHLLQAGAVEPDSPQITRLLDHLWRSWSPTVGTSFSSYYPVTDSDCTAIGLSVLKWGNYPVSADVLSYYEGEQDFFCYVDETNPALSAQVRLLSTLRKCDDHPNYPAWSAKIVGTLHRLDENGSYWWDKWHASPYYVSGIALDALRGLDDRLVRSRLKWILRTQNDDGGWGYLGESTPEETAYCLQALTKWYNLGETFDRSIMDAAANYLWKNLFSYRKIPLWIGKSMYHPEGPVRAAILGALHRYVPIQLR